MTSFMCPWLSKKEQIIYEKYNNLPWATYKKVAEELWMSWAWVFKIVDKLIKRGVLMKLDNWTIISVYMDKLDKFVRINRERYKRV
jgi:DNA-binding Lrp family transcriptional regulator